MVTAFLTRRRSWPKIVRILQFVIQGVDGMDKSTARRENFNENIGGYDLTFSIGRFSRSAEGSDLKFVINGFTVQTHI